MEPGSCQVLSAAPCQFEHHGPLGIFESKDIASGIFILPSGHTGYAEEFIVLIKLKTLFIQPTQRPKQGVRG